MSARILIVDDEPSISETIVYALESEGYCTETASTGAEATAHVQRQAPDLVVLDVGLPDMNGFEWCKVFRKEHTIPVLFLTARSGEVDRVVGLEIGGDDYVTKPFSPRELTARVRAILRRVSTGQTSERTDDGESRKRFGPFLVDSSRYQIWYHNTPLTLSRYEFRLLRHLVEHPGRVYTRAQLMDHAWEEPEASMERTVDSHIKSLRSKLREVDSAEDPILTHRGIGYSLAELM